MKFITNPSFLSSSFRPYNLLSTPTHLLPISDITPPLHPKAIYLWDVQLLIVLVTAIPTLSCGPVSIDQVPVEPEQGFCVVEVRKDLLLGHVHIQVLQARWENKGVYDITEPGESELVSLTGRDNASLLYKYFRESEYEGWLRINSFNSIKNSS